MYVRDRELGKIFEDLFGLFHKYLVFVQCSQTHVVLSKDKKPREENEAHCFAKRGKRKELARKRKKKTHLYGSPPGDADAPRRVLERNAPANRDEARRLEGFYAVHNAPYHLLRLGRRRRSGIHPLVRRLVKVDFGHR